MYNGKSGGKMRGLYSSKTEIRHKIFTEIARMAYEEQSPEEVLEELPYKIIPGEVATYRDSIFLERAVSVCVWQWECR